MSPSSGSAKNLHPISWGGGGGVGAKEKIGNAQYNSHYLCFSHDWPRLPTPFVIQNISDSQSGQAGSITKSSAAPAELALVM